MKPLPIWVVIITTTWCLLSPLQVSQQSFIKSESSKHKVTIRLVANIKSRYKLEKVVVPQSVKGVTNCGSNPYAAEIYKRESTCNTAAINPLGYKGLGQTLNLPCSLNDWTCQNNWFTQYAIRRYGSWKAAWEFWQKHSWW